MPEVLSARTREGLLADLQGARLSERDATFSEIFETFRQKVFSLSLHLTGDRADAEDATQSL